MLKLFIDCLSINPSDIMSMNKLPVQKKIHMLNDKVCVACFFESKMYN